MVEPQSHARLRGRIPINGAPASRFGAPPDGHTLLHVTAAVVINPHVYLKLPYDVFRDFEPATNAVLGTGYLVLLHPALPANTAKELIALARTPAHVLARLHPEVAKSLQAPRVREVIVTGGYEPDGRPPAEFRAFPQIEYARYAEMVRVANVSKTTH